MSSTHQIAQLGHPVLRQKTTPIQEMTHPSVQSLIEEMLITVSETHGVGLAAPQVYESVSLFIMASRPNSRYPSASLMTPMAVINPEIIEYSEERHKDWEGCLSVPGIRALVPRAQKIKVRYFTQDNQLKEQELTDFLARIFQHEFDHLNGLSFLDRLESTKDIITEQEFQKQFVKNEH